MSRDSTKILVIEDDDAVRLPLIDVLEAHGYAIASASNGKDGIKLARNEEPDLIISDIMMPEVDGFGVFEALQEDARTGIIPFIFLSAKTDPSDIREGLSLGADDYITKPFEVRDLLDAIRVRLERHQKISEAASDQKQAPFDRIFVKDGEKCWLVEYERLRLIESDDNYVRLHFDDQSPLLSRTLQQLEDRLPKSLFFRANRKQIVNLEWITNVQPWFNGGLMLTLKDKESTKVQMSRRAAQFFRSQLGI